MEKVISIVGAGGKTTLVHKLAREYHRRGKGVLVTTTTHMYVEADTDLSCDFFALRDKIIKDGYCMAGQKISEQSKPKMCGLAEMTFYANGKAVSPIAVWGSPTEKGNMHVLAKHVADGDPLSYYLSLDKGGEVVVDLGRVAVIDCLEYMPRNDDNFISPGDIYELFCHAGTEGWKSLGKQRADTTCLDWIVPDNALFWLRDLTRGREEHIFFMQNRRQKFPTF